MFHGNRSPGILLLLMLVGAAQAQSDPSRLRLTASKGDKAALAQLVTLAEKGNPDAQLFLGVMYHQGNGVTKDILQAVNWYRKAGDQGEAAAQFNLAMMYINGDGVPKDAVQAAAWDRRAAEQGTSAVPTRLDV